MDSLRFFLKDNPNEIPSFGALIESTERFYGKVVYRFVSQLEVTSVVLVGDRIRLLDEMFQPLFIHDCTSCKYYGTVQGVDLYVCGPPEDKTLIMRTGDDPSDNTTYRITTRNVSGGYLVGGNIVYESGTLWICGKHYQIKLLEVKL